MNFIASMKSPLAEVGIWNSLTSVQKRIMGIALLAMSALAIGFCILSCFRNKKIEQINDKKDEDNKPKELEQFDKEADKTDKVAIEKLTPKQEHVADPKEERLTPEKEQEPIDSEAENLKPEENLEQADLTDQAEEKKATLSVQELQNLSIEEENVKQVLEIFNKIKDQPQDPLHIACKHYFGKFPLNPSKDFISAFQIIKQDPDIVSMIVDGAIEKWKSYEASEEEKDPLASNFTALLDSLSQDHDVFFDLLLILLEKVKTNKDDIRAPYNLRSIFEHLSDDQLEKMTTIILNKVNPPLDIIIFPLMWSQYNIDGKIEKILAIVLPSLQDVNDLQKLWNMDPLREKVCPKLSLKQYELLLTDWQANADENQVFDNLHAIFNSLRPTPEFVGLCMKLGIDVDKLIQAIELKMMYNVNCEYLPQLCGSYAVNILNSQESQDIKQAKIIELISMLSPAINDDLDKDDCHQFGRLLVENASADQFATLLPCFAKASFRRQRLAEATFRTLLMWTRPDHEKIKQAFTAYWPIWKEFNMFQPHCSWLIMLFIDSEEILKIAYEAVPDGMKAEIREYLGKAHHYQGSLYYQINLPKDVMERVLN